jgi:hypothetical protein
VRALIGEAASSSIRSYLRLNAASIFRREDRGLYMLREAPAEYTLKAQRETPTKAYSFGRSRLFEADCISWLQQRPENSIHAVVTDPPYGLVEYTSTQQEKLRIGKGESGAYLHHLMAQSALHYLALQFFRQMIWRRLLGSFLNGAESYLVFLYPAQMF